MSGTERFLPVFFRDDGGHVAVVTGLMMTVLMGFVALGVDTASLYRAKARVQSVSDLTAMTALRDVEALSHAPLPEPSQHRPAPARPEAAE